MNPKIWIACFIFLAASHRSGQGDEPEFLSKYREAAVEKWDDDIAKLEQLDAARFKPADQRSSGDEILMIGSSSIRRWENVDIDMAPYRIIRRGYGGAKYSDVAVFAKRLITPHRYRALVMFVGNDVSGGPGDHTPDQVSEMVDYIIGISHEHQPDAPILLIEVTPTIKRYEAWPKIRALNAGLRELALATPNVYFVATAGNILGPDAKPRSELFVEDQLHLNDQGYLEWSSLIRRRLDEVFRLRARFRASTTAEGSTP